MNASENVLGEGFTVVEKWFSNREEMLEVREALLANCLGAINALVVARYENVMHVWVSSPLDRFAVIGCIHATLHPEDVVAVGAVQPALAA